MDIIERDIVRLEQEIQKHDENSKTLRCNIKDLRKEQDELRALLSSENEYDKKALQCNIERLDSHMSQVEAVAGKEEAGVRQLKQMITVLRRKQCLLDPISPLTGTFLQE